ncbi:MAG: hypothetical protein IMY72_11500 [Bacteroidetes bacterium]|nr:hypothetical protein [Bacteroidota bacterium]
MKFKQLFIIFILLIFSHNVLAQEIDEDYETLLLEEEEELPNSAFKPVIAVGRGVFTFLGDIHNNFFNPFHGKFVTNATISRNISKCIDFNFFATFGRLTGNQYSLTPTENLNFETDIFAGGASLTYNFNHLLKQKRPISPFISIGIEALQFTPKGDIYDANGNLYQYLPNSTIRDIDGKLTSRDYKYETDLRDLDLFGYGKYSLMSFAIPIDIGANVIVTDRVTLRFGNTYHYSFTDFIDNVKKGSGLFKNDAFLYSYVSLRLDLFSPADEIVAVEKFKNLKFIITDKKDADQDGVDDFNDECPNTMQQAKVDFNGCAIDDDNDGVPNYLDKQPNTLANSIAVGTNGIRIIDSHLIALLYDPDAINRDEVHHYKKKTSKSSKKYNKIPAKFEKLDLNKDNYISVDELQKAIDSLFDFSSKLTVEDIYELQDFFFEQ